MAGLNDIITNKAMQQTTLPSWFDTAQQNVVNQATSAFGAAPTPQNTVAQRAVSQLSQPNNPFQQAVGSAQSIATGAANPWIVNPSTGQVTPNTSTAMGGLFSAQNEQLNQLLPNVTAPVMGSSIASGNFGSLRDQTAVNKAKADAQAQLFANQMDAFLKNQATGVNAASTVGNVAQQDIKNLLDVGQYQQAAPFMNVSNLGKVLGGIQAPTTVTNQTQLSPLNQVGGIISLLGGQTGTGGVLGQLGVNNGLQGLFKGIGNIFTGGGGSSSSSSGGGGISYNPDGSVINSTVPGNYGSTTGADPGYSNLF
jgi:hypothetical protein